MSLMLVESLVLAVAGGAVGLAVTFGGIRTLVSLAPANLPRLTEVGPSVDASEGGQDAVETA